MQCFKCSSFAQRIRTEHDRMATGKPILFIWQQREHEIEKGATYQLLEEEDGDKEGSAEDGSTVTQQGVHCSADEDSARGSEDGSVAVVETGSSTSSSPITVFLYVNFLLFY
ncbi:hypothetical protein Ahy_B10g101525 [Arachis hypogaea]|uniref:Uncharacterized protein n=1 Tax=Arachis hypogaea TaxID=3818 RepID=A0A444WZU8_ARAHY|nr:hypothetical protein Ahy_B10g101525 [Arachis hypogaea]